MRSWRKGRRRRWPAPPCHRERKRPPAQAASASAGLHLTLRSWMMPRCSCPPGPLKLSALPLTCPRAQRK
eukprot:1321679-Pyramimonas_sp.AAC.1